MIPNPSLTSLRAFDLVARHGTFTKAAQELNVTRPAISKQIKGLEEILGCQLVLRTRPKVMLTKQGQELAEGLQNGFDSISDSVKRVVERESRPNTVRLLIERDFASSWLAEQIGGFLVNNPGTSVEVNAEKNGNFRLGEDFSFRIFYGLKGQHKTDSLVEELLCDWIDVPLCAPEYREKHILENGECHDAHFLLDKNYDPWSAWYELTKQRQPDGQVTYSIYNETSLCLSATMAGSGITMGDSFLCLEAIESGRLVTPFKAGLRSVEKYWIYYPSSVQLPVSEKKFLKWLAETIKAYEQKVDQVFARIGIDVFEVPTRL